MDSYDLQMDFLPQYRPGGIGFVVYHHLKGISPGISCLPDNLGKAHYMIIQNRNLQRQRLEVGGLIMSRYMGEQVSGKVTYGQRPRR